MSRLRLYPFTIAESLQLEHAPTKEPFYLAAIARVSRKDFLRHLIKGGLPAVFATREEAVREALLSDWIDLTINRDLLMIPQRRFNPYLAFRILECIAKLPCPDLASIADVIKTDQRKISSHIEGLKTLFVINELSPHPAGIGKTLYFLCDVAIARKLGASFEKQLWT